MSLTIIALFVISTLSQLGAVLLLPATKGMTQLAPTLGVAAGYSIGVGCMSRLIYSGVNLSLLIPLITLLIMLSAVAVGVLYYGDSASPTKIALLLTAAGLIGVASRL